MRESTAERIRRRTLESREKTAMRKERAMTTEKTAEKTAEKAVISFFWKGEVRDESKVESSEPREERR